MFVAIDFLGLPLTRCFRTAVQAAAAAEAEGYEEFHILNATTNEIEEV